MRKSLLAALFTLSLFYVTPVAAQSPPFNKSYTINSTSVSSTDNISGRGLHYFRLCYSLENGSPTATLVLQKSDNNVAWATLVSSGSVSASGCTAITSDFTNYIRINPSSFSGGGSINAVVTGWIGNPEANLSGDVTLGNIDTIATITNPVTVTDGTGALNVIVDSGTLTAVTAITNALPAGTNVIGATSETPTTMKTYISVGTSEDESQVKASAGVLVSISAWNRNASAVAMLKCTNLTAANTTPGTSTIFFSMMIPAGSGFVDGNINATFDTALTCYIVLGAAATAVDEVAANEVGYNLRYR